MKLTPTLENYLHNKLPIGKDEQIIGTYTHHFAAYILPLLFLASFLVVIWSLIISFIFPIGAFGDRTIVDTQYTPYFTIFGIILSILALLFSYIPIWMKSQEQLILTDEALLQILQTSLFSDKVSQLSLQHVADVSVRQGFWGNILGYGTITIETPGEQKNYEFSFLSSPNDVSRVILETHENFIAALESGRMTTNFRSTQPSMRYTDTAPAQQPIQQAPYIDPAEYQKFLEYQKQQNRQ